VSYSGSIGWYFMSISRICEPWLGDRARLLAVGVLGFLHVEKLMYLAKQRQQRGLLQPLELLTPRVGSSRPTN
jgi:hypothetical protein